MSGAIQRVSTPADRLSKIRTQMRSVVDTISFTVDALKDDVGRIGTRHVVADDFHEAAIALVRSAEEVVDLAEKLTAVEEEVGT